MRRVTPALRHGCSFSPWVLTVQRNFPHLGRCIIDMYFSRLLLEKSVLPRQTQELQNFFPSTPLRGIKLKTSTIISSRPHVLVNSCGCHAALYIPYLPPLRSNLRQRVAMLHLFSL